MNNSYKEQVAAFAKMVQEQRKSINAIIVEGKKFDKIQVIETAKVIYFVERSTGNIFGAKSNTIINRHRFFGNVVNASKWDWSGNGGVNVSDESVVESGHYGSVKHYTVVKA